MKVQNNILASLSKPGFVFGVLIPAVEGLASSSAADSSEASLLHPSSSLTHSLGSVFDLPSPTIIII